MTQFRVDSAAVQATTARMTATIGAVRAEVDRLGGQLAELEGSWSGQAAAAFSALVVEWRSTQHAVEQNLETIAAGLAQAGQRYEEIELANSSMFRG